MPDLAAAMSETFCSPNTQASASTYHAPGWLPGGQLQTIYAYCLRQSQAFQYKRERWITPDDDFMDLDWLDGSDDSASLLVLLQGLEGCSRSHYALSLMEELRRHGVRGVVPHFRGCGAPITLAITRRLADMSVS